MAVIAASYPLLPSFPPARSVACSHGVGRQNSERHRDAGFQLHRHQSAGRLPGDVIEMRRIAANHRA